MMMRLLFVFAAAGAFSAPRRSGGPQQLGLRRDKTTMMAMPDFVVQGFVEASPVAKELTVYLLKTTISWGVPAVVAIFVGLIIVDEFKGGKKSKNDREAATYFGLDDEEPPANPLQQFFEGGGTASTRNRRTVPELLKIERLNARLESFDFSLTAAESGKAVALRRRRRERLQRAFTDEVGLYSLDDSKLDQLARAMKKLQVATTSAKDDIYEASAALRSSALMSTSVSNVTAEEESTTPWGKLLNKKFPLMKGKLKKAADRDMHMEAINEATTREIEAEEEFLTTVSEVLPDENARARFVRLATQRSTLRTSLTEAFALEENAPAPLSKARAFVVKFDGDVTASQVSALREEVTAVLGYANATRGDEVIVRLNSGGGTVTGYGLAAAQLLRLKTSGLRLVICVEQVAASGGYMMACVADKIVASPFAVLGSIGVISSVPNVYERLKKEGIEFQEITAGEFKRTLTPFKKVDERDILKQKSDLADIFRLFKSFVETHRPQLDIDKVATGETWFGADAMALNLCDELMTFDDICLGLYNDNFDVFSIAYSDTSKQPASSLLGASIAENRSLLANVAKLALPLVAELSKEADLLGLDGLTKSSNGPSSASLSFDKESLPKLLSTDPFTDKFGRLM